ncbi:MAG TPA: response regulator [Oceanobacillus sp.]|nr:response regulator [Oceanobacillus sp.]
MSTWMVVEDEPDIYEVLLAMFEMWGIEGVAFVDGEEAVAWIDEVDRGEFEGELPELALLDIRLPGSISGPMVGERLRKSPILQHSAIVLSTAYRLSAEEEKGVIERAGADHLMYKPLPKFNELKKLLEGIIAERRAKKAEAAKAAETPNTNAATQPAMPPIAPPPQPPTLPEVEEAETEVVSSKKEEK